MLIATPVPATPLVLTKSLCYRVVEDLPPGCPMCRHISPGPPALSVFFPPTSHGDHALLSSITFRLHHVIVTSRPSIHHHTSSHAFTNFSPDHFSPSNSLIFLIFRKPCLLLPFSPRCSHMTENNCFSFLRAIKHLLNV